jgi:bacterioferritin-associated ferredoxin
MKISAGLQGRDYVEINYEIKNGDVHVLEFHSVGCLEFLRKAKAWLLTLKKAPEKIELPLGEGHVEVLLREATQKIRGEWFLPYEEAELCHCRGSSTFVVDQAIVAGAHDVEKIARETSAGSQCGSCRRDSEKLIQFRLHREVLKKAA